MGRRSRMVAQRQDTRDVQTPSLARTPPLILGCARLTNWLKSEPRSSRRASANERWSSKPGLQEPAGTRSDSQWARLPRAPTNASDRRSAETRPPRSNVEWRLSPGSQNRPDVSNSVSNWTELSRMPAYESP